MEEWQTLERALGVLVCTFQRYCRKEGDRHRLSKRELQELLESELPSLRTVSLHLPVLFSCDRGREIWMELGGAVGVAGRKRLKGTPEMQDGHIARAFGH